jgi:hypothetical protein
VRRLAAAALALLAGCSTPPLTSEEEKGVSLPAYPSDAGLIEFAVAPGAMRFFVDAPSLSVPGKDGIVRYTLVARSTEGVRNVSYESLSCPTGQYRVHALGRADGSWGGREGEWRGVNDPWHRALYREYFCPLAEPIRDVDEGLRALRDGGHPFSKGFGS